MRAVRIFAAAGAITLAIANSAHADPGIAAATIVGGRLYVVGVTERPHTSVSLDGKFTAESDDSGNFQFELVYYPAGCIVKATIGATVYQARVEQCGEKCEPQRVTATQPAPAKGDGLSEAPVAQQSAARQPPPGGQPPDLATARPRLPGQTGALPARAPLIAHPVTDLPLRPKRPTVLSAVKPTVPVKAVRPHKSAAGPKLTPKPVLRKEPNEPAQHEQSDEAEPPDDLH